jgi:hypothetical protein
MTFGPNPAAEHLNAASDFDKTARVVSCQFAASRPLRGAAEHQGMSWWGHLQNLGNRIPGRTGTCRESSVASRHKNLYNKINLLYFKTTIYMK